MPLPPYPFAPAPRTWAAGDQITTRRLRDDLANAVLLGAYRPMLVAAQTLAGQALSGGGAQNQVTLDTETLDAWNGHQDPGSNYVVPLPGWYLCEGDVECLTLAATDSLTAGIRTVANGSPTFTDGGKITGNGSNNPGAACADLRQLDSSTGDVAGLYASVNGAASSIATPGAHFKAEWVALPSTLSSGNGTVVTSPQPAAVWAPGGGTTITNAGGIAAGATSVTVAATTGMIIGGTLGLDYLNGAETAPTAETVTITNIVGLVVSISATLFSHAQTAPVAVPVSAAWMNQQARDLINFLAYPPIALLDTSGTAATLASQTWPAGTNISMTRAIVDNFSGWNGTTQYVFPVGGVYYIYGQVYLATAANYSMGAGLAINGGTAMYGSTPANSSATSRTLCATVRRHLRVTAGQHVSLIGSQNLGSSLALQGSSGAFCRLIVVWRGF